MPFHLMIEIASVPGMLIKMVVPKNWIDATMQGQS